MGRKGRDAAVLGVDVEVLLAREEAEEETFDGAISRAEKVMLVLRVL